MRAYSTGFDLIGSLRAGVYVAAAEDDYVVLWSGRQRCPSLRPLCGHIYASKCLQM